MPQSDATPFWPARPPGWIQRAHRRGIAAVAVLALSISECSVSAADALSKNGLQGAPATHWAYRPLQEPTSPLLSAEELSWCRRPMDAWIRTGMRTRGLEPSPDADRRTLGRRISFDLVGLPPGAEALEAFVKDPSPDDEAIARWVDPLIASPRFGEHWARRWMDIARYAESVTLRGLIFKEAWRYREYLVDSFNRDVPVDQLIREQIAGDLMPASTVAEASRQLVATTFLMLGNSNLEEQDKRQLEMDVVDEQLDVLGKAFLGQTLGCARCHDHKFDPVSTREYYALAGILNNLVALKHDNVSGWQERPLPLEPSEEAVHRAHESKVAALTSEVEAARGRLKAAGQSTPTAAAPSESNPEVRTLRDLERQLKQLKASGPVRPKAMAPLEATNSVDMAVLKRGSVHSPGEVVHRGFPQALGANAASAPNALQSGRRELAEWIVSPEQALSRRVLVNRFWVWLMGEGLVRTPDNFGITGDPPTHPELLDALAGRFGRPRDAQDGMGWSAKALIREIVLSRTYRQRAAAPQDRDPENRGWAHAFWKPLTAEQLRDSLLTVGSGIDHSRVMGPGFPQDLAADYGFEMPSNRRSLYLPQFRNALPEIVTVFDGASASMVTGRRDRSVVAPQALFLMNDTWIWDQAHRAAARMSEQPALGMALETRLLALHREILLREPTAAELDLGRRCLRGNENTADAWAAWVHALLASVEFRMVY